jgi:hypothetical protein
MKKYTNKVSMAERKRRHWLDPVRVFGYRYTGQTGDTGPKLSKKI